jgi:methanogen homocitrate synthase
MEKPWIHEKWISSQFNFEKGVMSKMDLPKNVKIHDSTLRDGEQQTGVVFRKEDKIRIAQALDSLGVQEIEASMPAVSVEDFEATRAMTQLGLSAKLYTFSLPKKEHVDLARKCDVWGVVMEVLTSDILIEKGLGWSKLKVLEDAVKAANYAVDQGLRVSLFMADSTRADEIYLKKMVETITNQVVVDSITVVDSLGVVSPQGFAHLVKLIKSWAPEIPIGVHCHNSLGLATANSLSGVASGAEFVHTTVNGISEGAGLAALEEVVMGLLLLYGIDAKIRTEKLCEISKLVEELSGVKIGRNKPVVGRDLFTVESGIPLAIHRRFREMNLPHGHLPFSPDLVGSEFRIALGKTSGHNAVEWRLEELGFKASDKQVREILKDVKELAIGRKRALTDEEFKSIVESVLAYKNS